MGWEEWWRTIPGFEPKPTVFLVSCFTNWAIWHSSDQYIPPPPLNDLHPWRSQPLIFTLKDHDPRLFSWPELTCQLQRLTWHKCKRMVEIMTFRLVQIPAPGSSVGRAPDEKFRGPVFKFQFGPLLFLPSCYNSIDWFTIKISSSTLIYLQADRATCTVYIFIEN